RHDGPGLQARERPTRHASRKLPPAVEHRRAPAARQRAARLDEPRRSATAARRRAAADPRLAPPPPLDEARDHVHLAGEWQERRRLRELDEARAAVRGRVVARARREGARAHGARRAAGKGRAVKCACWPAAISPTRSARSARSTSYWPTAAPSWCDPKS